MSMSRFAFSTAWSASHRQDGVPVDTLPLRRAVIGDGLLLIPGDRGTLSLYSVAAGYATSLGVFRDALAAWAALDALDLTEVS
jgi:hypothetical protein